MNSQAPSIPRAPDSLSNVREGSIASLRRRLEGDLDTIVLHAMNKEPQRRYVSVEQFAEDIRRHLDGRPVMARRDSWTYRAGKFAVRHKLGVAATVLILIAIAGGVAATIREARIAAYNERRAEQRFNDVRKLANSLMFEIHDAIRDLPGSTPARKLIVSRALEYLDNLRSQSKGDLSLQKEMAEAYERVGDVLGYPYAANLGDSPGALESYRKALAIRESMVAASPGDNASQRSLLGIYFRLAQVLESMGNFPDALAALGKAQPIAEHLGEGSKDPAIVDMLAGVYYFTAGLKMHTGDPVSALENYRRSASIRDAGVQANPGSSVLRVHLAADYGGVAKCLAVNHDLAHAIEMQTRATAILANSSKADPGNATLSEYLGEGLTLLADYSNENGDPASGLNNYRQAHKIFEDLLAADPKNTLAKANVGFSNSGIGASLLELHKPDEAIQTLRVSIATFEEMSPKIAGNRFPRTGLAASYLTLGYAYQALANVRGTAPNRKREYWTGAYSSCQTSVAIWKDKESRGELESGERNSMSEATQCVASSEAQLGHLVPKFSRLY